MQFYILIGKDAEVFKADFPFFFLFSFSHLYLPCLPFIILPMVQLIPSFLYSLVLLLQEDFPLRATFRAVFTAFTAGRCDYRV